MRPVSHFEASPHTSMRTARFRISVLLLVAAMALVAPGRADAYIEPGSGSYMFQLLIAGGMAALYAVKHFWGRIRSFIGGLFRPQRG